MRSSSGLMCSYRVDFFSEIKTFQYSFETMLEPGSSNTTAAQIVSEASKVEQAAFEKDRNGDVTSAISLYNQVASKLSAAAAQLPMNSEDAKAILNHRIEVLRRIDYLQSLFPGQEAAIPLEQHILPATVGVAQSSRPETPSKKSGPSTMAVAAGIGGIGGLILLGPITAVAGAVGLAYATTRKDTVVGKTVVGVSDASAAVVGGVSKIDQKHGISTKAKVFAVTAFSKTKEFDDRYKVTSTVKSGVASAVTKISETNEKYKLTDRAASAISSGFTTMTNWIGKPTTPTGTQPPPPNY